MAIKKKSIKKAPVKKAPVKKAPVKKAPVKKAPVKKTPVKKTIRKKAIGFTVMKSFQNKIEKSFANLQKQFDNCGVTLNEFVYEGKKGNAVTARGQLMDITKEVKNLRTIIQEAKLKLKPIYK